MKAISRVTFIACLLTGAAFAQSPVGLEIGAAAPGEPIPADYVGLSFDTVTLQHDSPGLSGYFFDSTNRQLVTLFRNLGIKNLRVGGSTVDANDAGYIPAEQDIDALFRFAKAAGVKVIYSLRLLNGDPLQDASAARYLWDHYRQDLVCFAIGNEPNLYSKKDPEITNDASYVAKWRRFAAVVRKAVPDCTFGGPDTGTGGTAWAADFAKSEAGSGWVGVICTHLYVGRGFHGKTAPQLIDGMLSPAWDAVNYPAYYDRVGAVARSLSLPYRLTELNSWVAEFPGVWGGNNSFASALFALDCMHWWAAHHCSGVNLHTFFGKLNGTIYRDANGNCQIYPIGYGIKAFAVGGNGNVRPVAIANPDHLNLTAYAVGAADGNLFITIVNREHGAGARNARVSVNAMGSPAGVMFLTSPNDSTADTSGISLGGAAIDGSGGWQGRWSPLDAVKTSDGLVTVPACSAAIVKLVGPPSPGG